MPRILRVDVGNLVYHVINRANGRIQIFHKDKDYLLFESVLAEAKELNGMRILAYCIMPNHWHLVLHPRKETGSKRGNGKRGNGVRSPLRKNSPMLSIGNASHSTSRRNGVRSHF